VAFADFDSNYQPINSQFPGSAPGSYVVQSGDTLTGIALALWGDSSLWWMLADANNLTLDVDLQPNTVLTVPNKVTNIHNNSATFRPYDAGKAIGNTQPTLPDAPPPPPAPGKKGGCGGVLQVVAIAVAVVATIYTAGAAASLLGVTATAGATTTFGAGVAVLGGSAGLTAGAIGAAAIGGAVGSIAGQSVLIAGGEQNGFNWKGVAMGAIGAAVTAGIGAASPGGVSLGARIDSVTRGGVLGQAAQGAVRSAVTDVLGSVTGAQAFSWKDVAASAVSAGASYGSGLLTKNWDPTVSQAVSVASSGVASGVVRGNLSQSWMGIAQDVIGSTVGNAIVDRLTQVPSLDVTYDAPRFSLDPMSVGVADLQPEVGGALYPQQFSRAMSSAGSQGYDPASLRWTEPGFVPSATAGREADAITLSAAQAKINPVDPAENALWIANMDAEAAHSRQGDILKGFYTRQYESQQLARQKSQEVDEAVRHHGNVSSAMIVVPSVLGMAVGSIAGAGIVVEGVPTLASAAGRVGTGLTRLVPESMRGPLGAGAFAFGTAFSLAEFGKGVITRDYVSLLTGLTGGAGAVELAAGRSAVGAAYRPVPWLERAESEFISVSNIEDVTTFYHGTTSENAALIRSNGIDLSAGRMGTDFGQGFYMTTSRDEALLSAGQAAGGRSLDVVEFLVPNAELARLDTVRFGSAGPDWGDFVAFNRNLDVPYLPPTEWMPNPDMVTGPLFRRMGGGGPVAWPNRVPQTSIHSPNAVTVFDRYMVR
jgi:hypothetical protein